MLRENYVVDKVEELCRERGWTHYRLSKECGIAHSTLHNTLRQGTIPQLSTIDRLCDAFGISLAQFFDDDTGAHLSVQERNMLNGYRELSEDQKKTAELFVKWLADSGT